MSAQVREPDQDGPLQTCGPRLRCISPRRASSWPSARAWASRHGSPPRHVHSGVWAGVAPRPVRAEGRPHGDRSSDCRVSLRPARGRGGGEAPCAVSASISFQLIRWALFSGPVHSLILRCRTWSSPHARSQLSPRYFQPRSACTQEAGERRRTETFKEPPEHKCGRQRLP